MAHPAHILILTILLTQTLLAATPNQPAASVRAESHTTPQTPCTPHFTQVGEGEANITVANPIAGQTVIAASAANISNPAGYTQFDYNPNYTVWWTQAVGAQKYSFKSEGGVAGYLTCNLNLSLKLLRYAQDQTRYTPPTYGYTELLVVVVCYAPQGCGDSYAAETPLVGASRAALGHTLEFRYALLNYTGQYIPINVSTTQSSVFLIGVSHELYGFVEGTVTPKDATVLVNGTRYPTPNGVINWTLHYGIYNVTFLAEGYINMSVVIAVAGGQVTPLSVSLSNPTILYEKTLSRVLGYYVLGLLAAAVVFVGVAAARRGGRGGRFAVMDAL